MQNKNDLVRFVEILEAAVTELEYGTLQVNVVLINGVPQIKTMHMVKSKRKRYQIGKGVNK